jgi:hypothetical protein
MGIDDVPAQIGRVIRFSVRSKSSFIWSFVTAAFVIGFAADLLYGFAYIRIYNVKDAVYTRAALAALGAISLGIPMIAGLYAGIGAWRATRPFKPGRFGVAIAPFMVHSIDPEVLGTPSKKQGLEDAIAQFFNALRARLGEQAWYADFAFRSLPPFVRVTNEAEARTRLASLSASLLIWGMTVHKGGQPLVLRINLSGPDTQLAFSGQMDPIQMADAFGYFLLTAAGFTQLKQGNPATALRLFGNATEFASNLDEMSKTNTHAGQLRVWRDEANAALTASPVAPH